MLRDGCNKRDLHDEVRMVFVDAVVAQVNARVVETAVIRRVLDGGESHYAVPV